MENYITELNRLAVFSDETEYYRFPSNPKKGERVTVKIRVAENDTDSVCIVAGSNIFKMEKFESINGFDFYFCDLEYYEDVLKYYFEIKRGERTYYYSKVGVSEEILHYADFMIIYGFDIPEWINGAVMYQIYVDRFCDGDKNNNVITNEYMYLGKPVVFKKDWNEVPSSDDVRNFYGGDLQGVIDKLPYLSQLGIEAVYFNPLFVSPSNHKYDTQDYSHIDPHIGKIVQDNGRILEKGEHSNENAERYIVRTTNRANLEESDKLFALLVQKAHEHGIKIILDGVFNHCGAFNKWLDREHIYTKSGTESTGAFHSKESKYKNYFIWHDEDGWPENESYECWWGLNNHPKLNYEDSHELMKNIMDTAAKWLKKPYYADGWRIDVGADLGKTEGFNRYFWRKFRKRVKDTNPNAVILAEHYGDASSWLTGNQWDTVMNYDAFMEPVSYFFTGMEKHSDYFNRDLYNNGVAFANAMVQAMARLPHQSLVSAMNQLSNHDHSRFLTRTNMSEGRIATNGSISASEGINKNIFREAVLFQMTWPGAPTVYYGDEAGLIGWTDPDNRRTYPWGKEDKDLIEFHKAVIKLRKDNSVLKNGSVMFLNEGTGLISYGRFDGHNIMIAAFNNNEYDMTVSIPVWRCGAENGKKFKVVFNSNGDESENMYITDNGKTEVFIKSRNGVLLSYGD